jgi:predicted Zn-dependent protease
MRSADYQSKLEAEPDNPLYQFSLGEALFDEGNEADAIPPLEAAIEAKPDWMMAHILLGKAQLQVGNQEAAKKHLLEALSLARAQDHEGPQAEIEGLLQGLA